MKHIRTAVLLVLFFAILFPIYADFDDARLEAMGSIGIAVSDTRHPTVINPASLYFFDEDHLFVVNGQYLDSFLPNSGDTFPNLPASGFNASFIGKMISFSIGFDYYVQLNGEAEDVKYYNIYQQSEIKLNLSAGLGNFSAGIGVSGGSSKQRTSVPIHKDTALADFFAQTFLTSYDRLLDSEFLQINLGLMFKYGGLSIGLLCDNILDNNGSKTSISWNSFISETGIGIYYALDEYAKRGRLNLVNFSAGLEIKNVFTSETRALSAGVEAALMLAKNYGFYLRTGYQAKFKAFGLGTHSIGFGAQLSNVELYANAHFPVSLYKGLDNGDSFNLAMAFTIRI